MAQTIKQKCDAIGISLPTYYLRLKNGMTPEEALSTPNKRRASKLKPTPKRYGVAKEPWPDPWNAADETKFNNACGGYTAVILNHTKDGEFKYQIYSTKSKNKLYTDDVVRFINAIIKICDPEGKTPFRVIAR